MNKNFNGAIKCRDHSITCCVSRRRNTLRSVKNSQTVTTQSSAKTESTSTTRSVAQTISKEEVKEPMKTYEVGALLEAANQRDTKKVKEILQNTTYQVDEVDTEGNTPLNIAVHNNDIEIAKALIDRGADINLQNSISDSPYLYAGAQGRTEILAYMLKMRPQI